MAPRTAPPARRREVVEAPVSPAGRAIAGLTMAFFALALAWSWFGSVDSTVQLLAVHTIGGVVTPRQAVLAIVPGDSRLEIDANLATRDMGFVQPGPDVEVKVEAFSFTRYGLLHGEVDSVSRDAVVSGNGGEGAPQAGGADDDAERQAQQPAYVGHISVTETGIETEQGFRPIEPGMAVTAEIKTGHRRLIEYLLQPILRYRHDAGRER